MSDIIAQLQVLAANNGCLLDLAAILDLSICPSIEIRTTKPHNTHEEPDCIVVTPTIDIELDAKVAARTAAKVNAKVDAKVDVRNVDIDLFHVPQQVCQRSLVSLDIDLLLVLGLITEVDLNLYLQVLGHLGPHEKICYQPDQCQVDPTLSQHNNHNGGEPLINIGLGDDQTHGSLIDLHALGKDGLVNLNLGKQNLLHVGRDIIVPVVADIPVDVNLKRNAPTCQRSPYITHFQPVCGKTFKNKNSGKHIKAIDVNHCLAHCHAEAALVTVSANVHLGDLAHINVCAAIEFEETDGNNCHYWVQPENQPCGELENGNGCTAFIRN